MPAKKTDKPKKKPSKYDEVVSIPNLPDDFGEAVTFLMKNSKATEQKKPLNKENDKDGK